MRRRHESNRIFTLNNPLSPRICPELAVEIGLNESVLLLQYEFWLATEGEERDGYIWIRRTVREIRKDFCFWSTGTIGNIIQSLVKSGYMVEGKYDDAPGKNGRWLRFDFDRLSTLKSIHIICPDSEQPLSKNTPISVQDLNTRPYIDKNKNNGVVSLTHERPPKTQSETHVRLMVFLTVENGGSLPYRPKEARALTWLIENHTEQDILDCFNYLKSEEWRTTAVTWQTVQKEIGQWLERRKHADEPKKRTPTIRERLGIIIPDPSADFLAEQRGG